MTTLEKDRKATYHYFRMILLASIFVGGIICHIHIQDEAPPVMFVGLQTPLTSSLYLP